VGVQAAQFRDEGTKESDLDALGQQGWELVAISNVLKSGVPIFYFKRPL
jgi:hypothetical protein